MSLHATASAPTLIPLKFAPRARDTHRVVASNIDAKITPTVAAQHEPLPVAVFDPNSLAPDVDGVLMAAVINNDPKITVIPNLLTPEECQHLIELTKNRLAPSLTWGRPGAKVDSWKALTGPARTSSSGVIDYGETEIVSNIENRVAQIAGMNLGNLEKLCCVHYSPGQFYKPHLDGEWRPKTVFIYLNDLPEGDQGETHFWNLGLKIVPRAGTAVMWANTLPDGRGDPRTLHQGLPPQTGTKYGLNCFFNVAPQRTPVKVPNKRPPAAEIANAEARLQIPPATPFPQVPTKTYMNVRTSTSRHTVHNWAAPLPNLLNRYCSTTSMKKPLYR